MRYPRDDTYDESNNNEDNRRKGVVVVAVVSFLFLGLLALVKYQDTSDKVFGLQNFYEGKKRESVDPKAQYNKIYKNEVVESITCETTMKAAEKPMIVGKNVTWIVDGKSISSKAELKKLAPNGDLTQIKPFKNGDMIVSPTELQFINSNVVQYDKDKITIKALVGSKYVIEFYDVKSWWCHIGKDKQNLHTDVVGKNGINPKCIEGYIIGEAKKSTIVKFYEVDNGKEVPCKIIELYDLK